MRLDEMTVKELRRYAIDQGYGIRYLSERKKDEIIAAIRECERAREKLQQDVTYRSDYPQRDRVTR